jgi:hypothetical protein
MTTTSPSPRATPDKRPQKSRGELVFDILLIVGIGAYLVVAQTYPPIGREIPTVVGVVALAAAVLQLIGWFVPGMWSFTHGDATKDHLSPAGPPAGTASDGGPNERAATVDAAAVDSATDASVLEEAAPGTAPLEAGAPRSRSRDVPVVMAWAAGFMAAILLIGYVFAVPLFFLTYFCARRAWWLAIGSAVVMGLVTRFLFETLLGIPLPSGILF